MTLIVLHLSDIHIKTKNDPVLSRARDIAACVYSSLPDASSVFIVVSGDIAFSGKAEQYALAHTMFKAIAADIRREKHIPIRFVVCPGNHDCDFELSNNLRELALEAIAQKGSSVIDKSVIETCCAVQAPFFAFAKELDENYASANGDPLWHTFRFDVGGKDVAFDVINVAWMSRVIEEKGTIGFPYERYIKESQDKPELRIGVLHHPFNWLSQHVYHPFRKALRSREHAIFTGHEHIGNVGENIDAESGHSALRDVFFRENMISVGPRLTSWCLI